MGRQSGRLLLRGDAVLVERFSEELRDFRRLAALDLVAVQHEDRPAIPEERHGRRGWGEAGEQFSDPCHGLQVCPCKDGRGGVWSNVMRQRDPDGRPRFPGRAPAYRVNDHEHGSAAGPNRAVNLLRRPRLLNAILS